jgi:resuscitation-promoting factor RpfA
MQRDAIEEGVRRGDLDELLRMIDACCAARAWDALVALHDACERSHETGRQLWPAASHAAYRLALEAPVRYAAAMLVDRRGRFAPGPLPEVVAQTHSWRDLAPHAPPGALATIAAHERVVRGEDVSFDPPAGPVVLELPWALEPWEPRYPVAEYHDHRAEFPSPSMPSLHPVALGAPAARLDADEVTVALGELARVWATESNGRVDTAAVHGRAVDAIAALGPRSVRLAEVPGASALAHTAWAAASGGAHGRRRGAAAGRFGAWWLVGALAGALDDWPPPGGRLEQTVVSCRWYLWDAAEPATGWHLRLAVEDPEGRAWALAATDAT